MTSQRRQSRDLDPVESRRQPTGLQDIPDYSHPCQPNFQSPGYSRALAHSARQPLAGLSSNRDEPKYEISAPGLSHPDPLGMQLGLSPSDLWEITNAKYLQSSPQEPQHVLPPTSYLNDSYNVTMPSRLSADGLIPLEYSGLFTPPWSSVPDEIQVFHRLGYFSRNTGTFLTSDSQLPRSLLTVFRSPDTKALRFQLTTEERTREQYSFELTSDTHQLVIAYADSSGQKLFRSENVVYIQQTSPKDTDLGKQVPVWERPGIKFLCRFDSMSDIAEFQAALLGESLNLAISHVSSVCYVLQPKETVRLDRCGIQVWHEVRGSPAMQSHVASRIVNGTKLAGCPMEGTRPRLTRVVIFLPREEEYLFFFITHDIKLVENGDDYRLSVRIQPRKSSCSLLRGKSGSSFLKLWHVRRSTQAAGGFLLGAPAPDPGSDESYQRCSSFEIRFEHKQEYQDFLDIWHQAMRFRYETKKVLRRVEQRMSWQRYTGKDALRLKF